MIYALTFAVTALIAAVFGFGLIRVESSEIARIIFFGAIISSALCFALARFGEPTPHWAESGSGR